jgi:hypothetical protein
VVVKGMIVRTNFVFINGTGDNYETFAFKHPGYKKMHFILSTDGTLTTHFIVNGNFIVKRV